MKYRTQIYEGDELIFEATSDSYTPLNKGAGAFKLAYEKGRDLGLTYKRSIWAGGWLVDRAEPVLA